MSWDSEQRLADWAKWYHEHENDGGDLAMQMAFMKKAVSGLYEICARQARDIQDLEGRPRESLGQPLFLPGTIRMKGDPRRLG